MTLKFTILGIEVTATDVAEAARLIREFGGPSVSTEPSSVSSPQVHSVKRPDRIITIKKKVFKHEPFNVPKAAVAFLTVLKQAGTTGVMADGMLAALELDNAKGIGTRLNKVNELLRKLGFTTKDVYRNRRKTKGRLWTAGPKIEDAIDAAASAARSAVVELAKSVS